jgi:undecaprenyl-diphosphatase
MSINVDLFYFINHNLQNPICDLILPLITHLGGFVWLLIILVVLIIYAKLKNKETLKKVAIIALCALLFADLITYAVKLIVQEPRPYLTLDNVRLLVYEDDVFAFPSGHSTSTVAVITIFVLKIRELVKKHYNVAKILLILFAIVIMFSRIYCGAHYPFDVLAGAIIGLVGALVVNRYENKILSKINF